MSAHAFDPNGVGLKNGNFIGLPFSEEEAAIILLPVPWDVTVSFAEGTATGPQNILDASSQLDLYDADIPEGWKAGIFFKNDRDAWLQQSKKLRPKSKAYIDFLEEGGKVVDNPEMQTILNEINQACLQLKNEVKETTAALLDQGKLVGLVGGDHSTPLGYLEALAEKHREFSVLQIDAHLDLREAYEGFTYSHASIFYNALKIPQIDKLVQVGIRDYCDTEAALVASLPDRIRVFYDKEIKEAGFKGGSFHNTCMEIIHSLGDKVYVSFDIDGLQPSYCPNTGTPVPGGFQFEEAVYLLKLLVESGRKIIGFDLNEVGGVGNDWDGNVGARILYQLCIWAAKSTGLDQPQQK